MRDVSPELFRRLAVLAVATTAWLVAFVLWSDAGMAQEADVADEIMFYADDGLFRYYDITSEATLPSLVLGGSGYSSGWDEIVPIDLDGGGQDEILFYRDDGLFRYYEIRADGTLGALIRGGSGYSAGWDEIVAIDLDGDGQDEILFYRDDGLFRYYDIKSNGSLGEVIKGGDGYTSGWSHIVALDLDADAQDEIFFYRDDGLYRFYNIQANASLPTPIRGGENYSSGWDEIVAIDLDGGAQDEMLFYMNDGLFRYYDVRADGSLGALINAGSGYSSGWATIAAVQLHGDQPLERVARFSTFFNCCENRVTNIRLIAAEVDETVVLPGQVFSIDEVTGPRVSSGGYLPAGYLVQGEGRCCAVGGGISQFGTTLHNAVFWAGYEIISHRPHTGWISRYPLGIEATLVYSSIDYRFRNDTPNPVIVRTSSSATSVTVEIWGNQGGWQVTGFHPRGSTTSRLTIIDEGGPDARQVSGWVVGSAPGSVTVFRRLVTDGIARTQKWGWNYVS